VTEELPLDRSAGDDRVDRTRADALARDYRAKGSVTVGRRRRYGSFAVAGLAALAVVYYVLTFAQVVHTGGAHGAGRSDAIIVMGAAQYDGRPSPQLAARLDHVAALWNDGVAPLIVVTGGSQPGDRFTEAEASARYLRDLGVPADAIVEVGEGGTTYDSVAAAAPVMDGLGVDTVALVTDPFHALRSRLIVESFEFDVDVATTPDGVVTGWTALRRDLVEAGGVAVGRIIGFGRLTSITG
jgi:vancomycin permeability regulator SanA